MVNLVKSARTTRILCCVLAGVNAAYLFREGLLALKLIAVGLLLTMVVLLFLGQFIQRQPGGRETEGPGSGPSISGIWMNAMLLALIVVSVRGAMA